MFRCFKNSALAGSRRNFGYGVLRSVTLSELDGEQTRNRIQSTVRDMPPLWNVVLHEACASENESFKGVVGYGLKQHLKEDFGIEETWPRTGM
jgi:hypothetical protein